MMRTHRLLSLWALFELGTTIAAAGSGSRRPKKTECGSQYARKSDLFDGESSDDADYFKRYKKIFPRVGDECKLKDHSSTSHLPWCKDWCFGLRCEDANKPKYNNVCPPDEECCEEGNFCWNPIEDDDLRGPEACGDPHMTGFLGQKFDFTGDDGGWYVLVADSGLHVNMRVTSPVADLPEITYITGLSVLTTDADGFDHSILIEVNDPHTLDSSCPADVSPCLADGSLRVVVDDEESLRAPGTVFVGEGVEVSAVNLPGACRSFGFEKYWERKKLEYAAHGRRLEGSMDMAEWILADPTVTNMAECEEYVAHADAGEDGVFAHQSEHASFQIVTPKGIIRLSHGRLHQVAMRDPTDQYDLPDHLTWQMNMAISHNEVSHSARGILGETYVPTRDANGEPIMHGMEAIRGTQEDYRVEGPLVTAFVQDAHTT